MTTITGSCEGRRRQRKHHRVQIVSRALSLRRHVAVRARPTGKLPAPLQSGGRGCLDGHWPFGTLVCPGAELIPVCSRQQPLLCTQRNRCPPVPRKLSSPARQSCMFRRPPSLIWSKRPVDSPGEHEGSEGGRAAWYTIYQSFPGNNPQRPVRGPVLPQITGLD